MPYAVTMQSLSVMQQLPLIIYTPEPVEFSVSTCVSVATSKSTSGDTILSVELSSTILHEEDSTSKLFNSLRSWSCTYSKNVKTNDFYHKIHPKYKGRRGTFSFRVLLTIFGSAGGRRAWRNPTGQDPIGQGTYPDSCRYLKRCDIGLESAREDPAKRGSGCSDGASLSNRGSIIDANVVSGTGDLLKISAAVLLLNG